MILSTLIERLQHALTMKGDGPVAVQDVMGVQHSLIDVCFEYEGSDPVRIEVYRMRSTAKALEADAHEHSLSGEHVQPVAPRKSLKEISETLGNVEITSATITSITADKIPAGSTGGSIPADMTDDRVGVEACKPRFPGRPTSMNGFTPEPFRTTTAEELADALNIPVTAVIPGTLAVNKLSDVYKRDIEHWHNKLSANTFGVFALRGEERQQALAHLEYLRNCLAIAEHQEHGQD